MHRIQRENHRHFDRRVTIDLSIVYQLIYVEFHNEFLMVVIVGPKEEVV